MNDKEIKIYGTLVNHTTDNTVAYARQVMDESFNAGEFQNEINMRVKDIRNENGKTYIDSELVAITINADNIIKGDSPVMTAADMSSQQTSSIIRLIAREEVDSVIDGAPAAFDTLKEISTWISQHQLDLIQYYTKSEVDNKVSDVRSDISNVNLALSNYFTKNEITNNYYTKSDITDLLEGLSPQQENITRLNIYDEQDNSKYSYIKCQLNNHEDPSIFVPELVVDDAITTDSLEVTNDGYIANLYVMNLHKFSNNDSYITVNTNFVPANGNECLGTENIPWNAVYTSDLTVTGDAYFASLETSGDVVVGNKLLIGDLTIRDNENNQGHIEVSGQGEDIWVLHYNVFFNDIYPVYVKTSKIDFYDSLSHQNKTARIEGVYDSVSDKTYLSVTGQLTVGNRNILNELNILNTFVENNGSAILNFFNSTDSLVGMLNSIHVVLLKENSDLGNNITVRCNKFVKDGGDLTVNVYDTTGEPSNTYSKTIYNASLVDITDSLDITDSQDSTSFTIEGVEEDLIISIEYLSAVTPPYNPGI